MANHFKHTNFFFWQKWLFYSSLLFAFAGILFACCGHSFLFQPYEKMLASTIWNDNQLPKDAALLSGFIYGPFGGTIACCYILLAFIAKYPFKEKQVWARNSIIVAFGVWVVLDSMACFYFEVYPQIYIINAFSIITKAFPIIFTWKEFSREGKTRL
jgi:hypothetical protein